VFDPWRVDDFYKQPREVRAASIAADRATNYGVVRLDLLEHLYAKMYQQEMCDPDQKQWQHRILTERTVLGVEKTPGEKSMKLRLLHRKNGAEEERLDVDLVVVATGYARDGHEDLLRSVRNLMDGGDQPHKGWEVQRDYRVRLDPQKVDSCAGIWLQGCNENTHGVSCSVSAVAGLYAG
jgi:L-ornithine N5-monooxygenase